MLSQNTKDTILQLKSVEIHAPKTLKETAIIKTELDTTILKNHSNNTLSDILSHHSPVYIKTYGQGGLATASFRGTAASHTQVEWNGININNPMLGQVDFSLIPVYFVDDISLLHGSSSLHTGSGALGGSIIINNKPQWNKPFELKAIQSLGSFCTYNSFIKIGFNTKKLFTDIRLNYTQSKNNFEFYNNANGQFNYEKQKNADFKTNAGSINLYYKINNHQIISIKTFGLISNRNLPPIMSYEGIGRNENQKDDQLKTVVEWKKYNKKINTHLSAGFSFSELKYYLANNTPFGLLKNYDSNSKTKSFYNKLNIDYTISKNTLLLASIYTNYHKVHIFDSTLLSGYNAYRTETGIMAKIHQNFKKNYTVYGLIKSEYIGQNFIPIIPAFGIEKKLNGKQPITIKINLAKNYHAPTLNDLYWLPGGNADLLPEKGYTGDLSLLHNKNIKNNWQLQTQISIYASFIEDWIVWRPCEYRYWMADNIREVFARGTELKNSIHTTINSVKLSLHTNYTYTLTTNKTKQTENNISYGKQLIYIPKHKANFLFNLQYKGFYFNYNFSATGKRYTTSSNEEIRHTLPAYFLHDANIGIKIKKLNFQFKTYNLYNINYQTILWKPMPKRYYEIIISYTINKNK